MDKTTAKPVESAILVYSNPDRSGTPIDQIMSPSGVQIVRWSDRFTAVQLRDGRCGFVESRFLTFPLKVLVLKQDRVPMYPSASAGNPVKTVLRNGALIDSLGDEVVADGIAWMPIRSPNGQTGCIRGDTRVGTPSRFYYFRHVSSFYFWNLWIGAFIFVCGVVLTLGGYLFARYVIGGGIFFIFYGMILTGFGQFFVALRRLNVEIAIQRRKYRERLR